MGVALINVTIIVLYSHSCNIHFSHHRSFVHCTQNSPLFYLQSLSPTCEFSFIEPRACACELRCFTRHSRTTNDLRTNRRTKASTSQLPYTFRLQSQSQSTSLSSSTKPTLLKVLLLYLKRILQSSSAHHHSLSLRTRGRFTRPATAIPPRLTLLPRAIVSRKPAAANIQS